MDARKSEGAIEARNAARTPGGQQRAATSLRSEGDQQQPGNQSERISAHQINSASHSRTIPQLRNQRDTL